MAPKTMINAKTGTNPVARGDQWRTATPIADIGVDEIYHSLVDGLTQMVFRKDLAGRFLYVNQRFCSWLGRDRAEILGRTDHDLFPADVADALALADRGVLESGDELGGVYEVLDRPEIRRLPVRDGRGCVIGLHGLLTVKAALDHRSALLGQLFASETSARFGGVQAERAEHGFTLEHEQRRVAAGDAVLGRERDGFALGAVAAIALQVGDPRRREQSRYERVAARVAGR